MFINNIPRKGSTGKDFTELQSNVETNLSKKLETVSSNLANTQTELNTTKTNVATAQTDITNLKTKTSSFYTVSTTAPSDTTKLWVDTSSGAAIMKYYNGGWKAINQTYS